jgi:hypothetical protein
VGHSIRSSPSCMAAKLKAWSAFPFGYDPVEAVRTRRLVPGGDSYSHLLTHNQQQPHQTTPQLYETDPRHRRSTGPSTGNPTWATRKHDL